MSDKNKTSRLSHNLELITAVIMGVLTLTLFAVQIWTFDAQTTQTETALFNILQFLLSVGFTWFSTRAISRNEFQESLRRFAISAYRRISDIEQMTKRLQDEVENMIAQSNTNEIHNLKVVKAIISDTSHIVRSSISDWADVIGDELLTIERIRNLENEKEEILSVQSTDAVSNNGQVSVNEINQQIVELLSTLPARLQVDTSAEINSSRSDQRAAEWLARSHRDQDGLHLTVVTGDIYRHDRDYKTLTPGEVLTTVKSSGKSNGLDVADEKGAVLGRLQNNTPLSYSQFVRAFELCYGKEPIRLKVIKTRDGEIRNGEYYGWFYVKVVVDPVFELRGQKYRPE